MRLLFMLFLASTFACSQARAGEAELKRFEAEYANASKIIVEKLAMVKGTGVIETKYTEIAPKKTEFEFQVDHGYQKVASNGARGRNSTGQGSIFCWGATSGFTLSRESNGGNLVVRARGTEPIQRTAYEFVYGRYLSAAYSVERLQPLVERIKNSTVSDLSAESVVIDGRKCIRVRYFRLSKLRTEDTAKKLDVTVDLDPDLGWVIVAASVRYPGTNAYCHFRNRYDPQRRNWPMPLSVEVKDYNGSSSRCEFRTVEFAPSPPEEFAMSYYGLPDIPGSPVLPVAASVSPLTATPTGRSWWRNPLFLGFIALALVGFVSARLLRSAALRTKRSEQISNS